MRNPNSFLKFLSHDWIKNAKKRSVSKPLKNGNKIQCLQQCNHFICQYILGYD